jgi:hypothetical protein
MHLAKRIVITAGAGIGLLALAAAALVFYVNYPDRDMLNMAEVYRAKQDIEGIENAVRLFHEKNKRYPQDLTELTRRDGGAGNDPWLVELPVSPWGGAYQYRVQSEPSGQSYRIWTVPDPVTQEALKLAELSNTTDWAAR